MALQPKDVGLGRLFDRLPADALIALPAVPPFHLEGTVRLLQRRPSNRVDGWDGHRYLRVLPTVAGLRLVMVENLGDVDAPDLRCSIAGGPVCSQTREAVSSMLTRMLGLDVDPAPFFAMAQSHTRLRQAAEALRGLRPPRFPTLFEAFANVIPFQQVSLAAGVAVVGRIVLRYGQHLNLNSGVYYAFPTPEDLVYADLGELRDLGLSRAKAGTLQGVARRIVSGELSEERLGALASELALQALTAVPGIGPWSAGLVLLRGLGRMDVFPSGDVGARRNLAHLLELDSSTPSADLQPHIDRMDSMKGFLYFYALAWRLMREGLITPVTDPA